MYFFFIFNGILIICFNRYRKVGYINLSLFFYLEMIVSNYILGGEIRFN